MRQARQRIVVVGGGIAGLASANKLHELSASQGADNCPEILLLEASGQTGGVIQTTKMEHCLLELGPDSFITQKPWALDLCRRLGLGDRIVQTNAACRRTFVVFRGKLQPLPEGFIMLAPTQWPPFITSPLFSLPGKLRMAMDLLLPERKESTDESVAQFVSRRLGRECLERVAQPMIAGVYTADAASLSLQATMPRFIDLEKQYGSVIKGMMARSACRGDTAGGVPVSTACDARRTVDENTGESLNCLAASSTDSGTRYSLFVSLEGGLQTLVETIIKRLPSGCVRLNAPVSQVVRGSQGRAWDVILRKGEKIAADGIVIAAPSFAAAQILSAVDNNLASDLSRIEYASSAVVNLVYNRADITHPLDGFGFVVPAGEPFSIMACSFSSVKFPQRAPSDKVLLRVFLGGALRPQLNDLQDDAMLETVKSDLSSLLGIVNDPLAWSVTRWPRSMPQYHVGHLDRLEQIDARLDALPVLALAGSAYRGVGIPDCIHSGEQAATVVSQLL